jgi:Asp-tRNA(Asn)/Glu-tRNA(Gln) amidotransferase B subunit
MKKTKGKANPKILNELFKKILDTEDTWKKQ